MYCQPFRTVLASDFWFLVSEILDSVSAAGANRFFAILELSTFWGFLAVRCQPERRGGN
jgi:hypothetical protein